MPNRVHHTDPFLTELRTAVQRVMAEKGHTQAQVFEQSGVTQAQLSRFLAGGGKRMTKRLWALCGYAELDPVSHGVLPDGQRELSQLLSEVIGDNPNAAQALLAVVQALAPVLRSLPHPTAPSGEVR